jgi:hypothetical protein
VVSSVRTIFRPNLTTRSISYNFSRAADDMQRQDGSVLRQVSCVKAFDIDPSDFYCKGEWS